MQRILACSFTVLTCKACIYIKGIVLTLCPHNKHALVPASLPARGNKPVSPAYVIRPHLFFKLKQCQGTPWNMFPSSINKHKDFDDNRYLNSKPNQKYFSFTAFFFTFL